MFSTPCAYSASSLRTARRAGQRQLSARAAAAAEAGAARLPKHVPCLSPDALRLLDPSLDGRGSLAMHLQCTAGVRGTDVRGRAYHEQGDPAMYTAENLAARDALRTAPVVIDAVARFSRLYQLDNDCLLRWPEYRRVHSAAAFILAPGVLRCEVDAALAAEWTRDSAGAAKLDYSRLFSAIFELADHWSTGIDGEQYAALLDALALAVHWRLTSEEHRGPDT